MLFVHEVRIDISEPVGEALAKILSDDMKERGLAFVNAKAVDGLIEAGVALAAAHPGEAADVWNAALAKLGPPPDDVTT